MIVVIEGPDGSGKSTQAKIAAGRFNLPLQCFPDRSTPIGKLIDQHLKGEICLASQGPTQTLHKCEEATVIDNGLGYPPSKDDALMFQALMVMNRVEKVDLLVECSGSMTHHLICDRFSESGYVFGSVDGLEEEHLELMLSPVPTGDVMILVDVPVAVSMERLKNRGQGNRYDEKEPDFLARIIDTYRKRWEDRAKEGNWFVVDGTKSKEEVALTIERIILARVFYQNVGEVGT